MLPYLVCILVVVYYQVNLSVKGLGLEKRRMITVVIKMKKMVMVSRRARMTKLEEIIVLLPRSLWYDVAILLIRFFASCSFKEWLICY